MISLSTDKQVGLWSRVAGDGLDLATLFGAYRSANPQRANVGVVIGMVIGITVLDIVTAQLTTTVHARKPNEWRRYNDRSGFPGGVQQVRSAARAKAGPGET
jgi:hypothetical protein